MLQQLGHSSLPDVMLIPLARPEGEPPQQNTQLHTARIAHINTGLAFGEAEKSNGTGE